MRADLIKVGIIGFVILIGVSEGRTKENSAGFVKSFEDRLKKNAGDKFDEYDSSPFQLGSVKNADYYYKKGLYYRSKENHTKALSAFEKCIELDRSYFAANKYVMNYYYEQRKYDMALSVANALIWDKSGYWEPHYVRAKILASKNRMAEALNDFAIAYSIDKKLAKDREFILAWEDAKSKNTSPYINRDFMIGAEVSKQPASSPTPTHVSPPIRILSPITDHVSPSVAVAAAQAPVSVKTPLTPSLAAVPETRVALVIGNGAYVSAERLENPGLDAATIARALLEAGFKTVQLKSDLRYDDMRRALNDFSAEADQADWAVVYYAGHGVEVGGINYLVPVDARLKTDRAVSFEAVPLDQVLTSIGGARKLRLVILDACRDNPFIQQMTRTFASRSIGQGLAKVELGESGTMVAFAAKHGQQAADAIAGQTNSPFVTALIENIAKPGIDIRRMFGMVRDQVLKSTRRQQEPYVYGSLGGDEFLFKQ